MPTLGNGLPFYSTQSTYYNPAAVFPKVVAVSAISPNVNNDTTPTQDVPGTPATNDIVFAHLMAANPAANATFTPPAGEGWASVASGYDTTGLDTRAQVFWKRWGAGFTDNTTIVFTSSHPNSRLVLTRVRGANAVAAPTGAALVGSSLAASTLLIAGSVDVPELGLLMRFYSAAGATVNVTPNTEPPIYDGAAYAWTVGSDGGLAASAMAAPSGFSIATTALASATPINGWATASIALAGESSLPVVDAVSAISANVDSPSATNTVPGTPITNDIVLAHLGCAASSVPAYTPPAGEGWQLAATIASSSGLDSALHIYWKRWGVGFVDNTSVTFTGVVGNSRLALVLVRGCRETGDPFDPEGVALQCDDATNDMACISPTLPIVPIVALVIRFYAAGANNIILNAPMVEKYDGPAYTFNAGAEGAMASSALIFAGGGTAPLRSARSSTNTANGWVGITVAVGN